MKELTIGITTYNNDPFVHTLLYELKEQVKKSPQILDYVDFCLYDDKSDKTGFLSEIPDFFKVIVADTNSGTPSIGRNYIIDNANAKYLLFIDGDDIIIRDIIDLLEEIRSKNTDILFSSVVKIGADGQWVHSPFIYSHTLAAKDTSLETIEKICAHQTGIWSIYNLNYLRKENIRYETDMRYEDNYLLYQILLAGATVGVINEPYYGWRTNFNSFSYSPNSLAQRASLYRKTLMLLENNVDNKFAPYILYSIWNQTYSNIIRNYPALTYSETRDYFRELNEVSNQNKELIQQLKLNVDSKYVDKYFLYTKLNVFRNFGFIYALKKINRVKNSKEVVKKSLAKLFSLLPLNKNKIFMTSQYGQYGSNPKYLYKKLKEQNSSLEIKYFVKDERLIDGKEFLDYKNKLLYYYHLYTSKTVYFDTWVDSSLKKVKNQTWIQMWHGYPYKKVYTDIKVYNKVNSEIKHKQKAKNIEKWDKVYSLDANNTEIFKNLFDEVEVIESGYERIDWLIKNRDNEKLKTRIRNKYNLKNQKYTLFAPTYRPYNVYFDQKEIQNLASSENQILYNPHPMLKTNYEHNGITLDDVDIQEILLICDELITDYSSIQYDFKQINDGAKVKYYQPDIELYGKIHGLYDESCGE